MAKHRLKSITALGTTAPLNERIGPIRLSERSDLALASLDARRGCESEFGVKAAQADIPLPGPGQAAESAPWGTFWVSPDMWMVEAAYGSHEDMVTHVKPLFGELASVTEQTDAWVRFEVEGPLGPLFERLCNIDFERFEPGSATRTVMEHLGVYVIRRAQDRMTVLGARSSASSLHHALAVAARSVF